MDLTTHKQSEIQNKLGRVPNFIQWLQKKPKSGRYDGVDPLILYADFNELNYNSFEHGKFFDEDDELLFSATTFTKLCHGDGYEPSGKTYGELITRCFQVHETKQTEQRQRDREALNQESK